MTKEDIMWKLLEQVLDGKISEDRARYILAGSGQLTEFDYQLREFKTCSKKKPK